MKCFCQIMKNLPPIRRAASFLGHFQLFDSGKVFYLSLDLVRRLLSLIRATTRFPATSRTIHDFVMELMGQTRPLQN
jgi:hypothetical protein